MALREMQDASPPHNRLAYQLAGAVVVGVVLAVVGPYGTYAQLDLGDRLIYWLSIVLLNSVQVRGFVAGLRRLLPHWPPASVAGLAACLASLPAAGEVLLLEHWLRPGVVAATRVSFAELYFLVLVITLPLSLMVMRLETKAKIAQAPDIAPPSPAPIGVIPTPFLDRIPPKLGRDLLCLKAEDHYLRIHTRLGEDLILMRMTDAEAQLAGTEGLRVHRSWWVARMAVAQVERDASGKATLILSNGLEVPVGRNYLGALRSARWL